jgi:hypothetical protein
LTKYTDTAASVVRKPTKRTSSQKLALATTKSLFYLTPDVATRFMQ